MFRAELARRPQDIERAAALCWPHVRAGQVGFGLAGQGSLPALTQAWLGCLDHPRDGVLLVRDGDELVGACGLFCADEHTVEWVNGPVALRDHAAIFDALLALVHTQWPGATLRVGVSHRHTEALAWLTRVARLDEHSYPYRGALRPIGAPTCLVVGEANWPRFAALYDATVGDELWWTSARIADDRDRWLCLVDHGWTAVLAARTIGDGSTSEVFALSRDASPEAARALTAAWAAESVCRGTEQGIFFAETATEREAAASVGLHCEDECLSWLVASPLRTT